MAKGGQFAGLISHALSGASSRCASSAACGSFSFEPPDSDRSTDSRTSGASFRILLTQRLHDAVDAVAGQAEDGINASADQQFYEKVGGRFKHKDSSLRATRKND